jgi:threonine/homoserine/homoserine lactone efflux protein
MDHLPAIAGPLGVAAITPGPNNLLLWATRRLAGALAGRSVFRRGVDIVMGTLLICCAGLLLLER